MNTTISFFISYIDALFPEGDIPSVDGAIDYCEIGKFIEMPPPQKEFFRIHETQNMRCVRLVFSGAIFLLFSRTYEVFTEKSRRL